MKPWILILIGVLVLDPVPTLASTTQIQVANQFQPAIFVSGIPTSNIRLSQTRQIESEWCWAASITTILRYYGCNVDQEAIVRHVHGNLSDTPGSPIDIYNALHFTASIDGNVRAIQSAQVMNDSQLIGYLDRENPVLLAYQHPQGGHAIVCTAITYAVGNFGIQVLGLTVRDPWPGSPRKQEWMMKLPPQVMQQFPPDQIPSEFRCPPPGIIQTMIAVWF